jgi:hypothetical protein
VTQPTVAEEAHHVFAGDVEQRANHAVSPPPRDSPEPTQACPASEAVKQRLRLVIERMRRGDGPISIPPSEVEECAVAGLAGALLEVGALRDLHLGHENLATEPRGELLYESAIAARLAPSQAMVDMPNADAPRSGIQLDERREQRHGVRPARYRDQDRLTRRQQAMSCDRPRDAFEKPLHDAAEGSSAAARCASLRRLPRQVAPWHASRLMVMRGLVLSLLLAGPALGAGAEDLPKDLPPGGGDQKRAVLELMRQNKQKYGDDAALLQTFLLTHSLKGEAVLTTESTILGFEELDGKRYVAYRLQSGVVMNDKKLDREQRLEHIWHVVLEGALRNYPKFTVPSDGLAVEIHYNHRPYEQISDLYDDDNEGAVEQAKFYIASSDLNDFLAHRIGAQEFLARSRVLLDDQPVKLRPAEVPAPEKPAEKAAEP